MIAEIGLPNGVDFRPIADIGQKDPDLHPAFLTSARGAYHGVHSIHRDLKLLDHVRDVAAPYMREKWESLTEHPLVGEAKIVGLMGSIALTPDKASRAPFAAPDGTAGFITRERCLANNLIMRHVADRMIISPPLVIQPDEIDELIRRAWLSLDQAHARLKDEGLMTKPS